MSYDPIPETKKKIVVGHAERASHKFQGRVDLGHGTYVGPNENLHMKGCLGQRGRKGKVILQFDDFEGEKSHGWFEFLRKDFIPDNRCNFDKDFAR